MLGYPQDAACSGPPFTFKLNANSTNMLRIRARDRAGNVSSDSGLVMVHDNTPPGLVLHQNSDGSTSAWAATDVAAGVGAVTISWEPPTDPDVGGYLVYYGPAASGSTTASAYNGTTAAQGPSPVDVGKPCAPNGNADNCVMRLTGLADGTPLTVSVVAYDNTPTLNVGALTPGVQVTPSFMSLSAASTVSPTVLGGGTNARGVAVRNGLAYVTTGDNGSFAVVDVSRPNAPVVLSTLPNLTAGYEVAVQGAYAYVADGTGGLQIIDVTFPLNPNLVNALSVAGLSATGVAIVGDHIYVSSNEGLYALSTNAADCSNGTPYAPCVMGYMGNTNAYVDVAAQGNTLYTALLNSSAVTVIDATTPGSMTVTGTCATGAPVEGLTVSGPWVYASSGATIALCDVSNPAAPVLVSQSPTTAATRRVGVGGGFAYATHAQGLSVSGLNVNAAGVPSLQSVTNYTTSGYNGDGGTATIPQSGRIAADGAYVYVAAGSKGLQVFNTVVSNRLQTTAKFMATPFGGSGASLPLGNLVVTASTRRFAAMHWSPTDANTYAATLLLGNSSYQLDSASGGIVVGTDNVSGGVYAQGILANANWATLGAYTPASAPRSFGVAVRWPYAFVAVDAGGASAPNEVANTLQAIDLRTFAQVGNVTFTPGSTVAPVAGRVATFGNLVYVTNGSTGGANNLIMINIGTPTAMVTRPSMASSYVLGDIKAVGTTLYVSHTRGFRMFNIGGGTPNLPTDVGGADTLPAGFAPDSIAVSGNYVLLSGANGSALYNVSNPASPALVTLHSTGITPTGAVFGGTTAVVNNAAGPVQFLRLN